jgi:D-glycero-alpha-D-manno-heptose-7-phosphate kinase
MITVKTPLRVNFLGGGSDFPEVFRAQGGSVFGASIDLSVYLAASLIPPFANERFRFTYRKTESVQNAIEFEHPVVRQIFFENPWLPPLNLATMSDVPGNSGLGSSSSFTVGLIKLISTLNGKNLSSTSIAKNAIRIERIELNEAGGWQDQLHASNGGLSLYSFLQNDDIKVQTVPENNSAISLLNESMLLIPFGEARDSSDLSQKYKNGLTDKTFLQLIEENAELARTISSLFQSSLLPPNEVMEFLGEAMRRAWAIKLLTNPEASLFNADGIISKALGNGALAGKLCGAGQSGFLFFLCDPLRKLEILKALDADVSFSPKVTYGGSTLYSLDGALSISSSTWLNH